MSDLMVHKVRSSFEERGVPVTRTFFIFASDDDRAGFCPGSLGYYHEADNTEANNGEIPDNLYVHLDSGDNTVPKSLTRSYIIAFTDNKHFLVETMPYLAFYHSFGPGRSVYQVKEQIREVLHEPVLEKIPPIKLNNHLQLVVTPNKGFGPQSKDVFSTVFSNFDKITIKHNTAEKDEEPQFEYHVHAVSGYKILRRIFEDTDTRLALAQR